MRFHPACVALIIALQAVNGTAQPAHRNGVQGPQIPPRNIRGASVAPGRGYPTGLSDRQDQAPWGLMRRADSLQSRHFDSRISGQSALKGRLQKDPRSPESRTSLQSHLFMFDTAIVRRIEDTTMHVYSFTAGGIRTSDVTQILTGDHWVNTDRLTDAYDANGNNVSTCSEEWSNGQWVGRDRVTSIYDAGGHRLSAQWETWSGGEWVIEGVTTWSYDAHDNKLTESSDTRTGDQVVNTVRLIYWYDARENQTASLYQIWSDGRWVTCDSTVFTYDAHDETTSCSDTYTWNGYSSFYRDTAAYDTGGHMTSCSSEQWVNGGLVVTLRDTPVYDENWNLTSDLTRRFADGRWVDTLRESLTYSETGQCLTISLEQWLNNTWALSLRYSNTYDDRGNLITFMKETGSNGVPGTSFLTQYSYDGQSDLAAIASYGRVGSCWIPMYDPRDGGLFMLDDAGNYYSLPAAFDIRLTTKRIVTGIATQKGSGPPLYILSNNYPNPFNPSTNIRYSLPAKTIVTLSVFDVLGRRVAILVDGVEGPGYHEATFDGSGLASGVYFCRMEAGDFVQTKSLLLLR